MKHSRFIVDLFCLRKPPHVHLYTGVDVHMHTGVCIYVEVSVYLKANHEDYETAVFHSMKRGCETGV